MIDGRHDRSTTTLPLRAQRLGAARKSSVLYILHSLDLPHGERESILQYREPGTNRSQVNIIRSRSISLYDIVLHGRRGSKMVRASIYRYRPAWICCCSDANQHQPPPPPPRITSLCGCVMRICPRPAAEMEAQFAKLAARGRRGEIRGRAPALGNSLRWLADLLNE